MKKKMYKVICLCLTVIMAVGCCTVFSYGGSKTVSSKFYTQCIKDGKTVYCVTGNGIYKVNIKKKTKKRLYELAAPFEGIRGIKLKKGYLYCAYSSLEDEEGLFRIKTSGKSEKWLVHFESDVEKISYATEGKRVYYYAKVEQYNEKNDSWTSKTYKKKMNLNGSKKKNTKKKAKTKYVKSNKKGYKIIEKHTGGEYSDKYKVYLKTPSKKIYITTVDYSGES